MARDTNNHSFQRTGSNFNISKRRLVFKTIFLVLLIGILSFLCFGAYEYHALNPKIHFNHLHVIGGNQTSTSQTGSSQTSPSTNGSTTKSKPTNKEKAGVFNALLIGSDARPGETVSHTDSMLLVHADLINHTYHILSLPRDTRVYMQGVGYTKLTSVQLLSQVKNGQKQGIIDAVKTISQLTGVPINYYAETNYVGLQDMVNAIGGITMNLPFDVTLTKPWYPEDKNMTFKKGTHKLNGKMVTEIVHERDSLPGTDYGRQQVQEAALIGIAKQVMDPTNITKLPALSKSLSKFLVATNMTKSDMVSIALGVKNDFHPKKQIVYHQVKGKNEVVYDDALKAKNEEIVLNPDQLKSVINQFFKN